MAKILLCGGMGFIGSHTAVELLQSGEDVMILDDLSNSRRELQARIEQITGRPVTFYQVDVTDRDEVDRIFKMENIDAVIHFAGYKAVAESVQLPLSYYRNNLDATITLLEVMQKHRVRRFVFSSSATVYGLRHRAPFGEDLESGGCTNPYGWTKFMSERIIEDFSASDPNFSAVILRYFNPVGAHESGDLGELPNGTPNNLMPYILQVAAGLRESLFVYGNDYPTKDGTGVRDYIHIQDLARGHSAALRYAQAHTGTEVVNLGTGRGFSVLDVVNTFEAVNGISVPTVMAPRRAGDMAECYADTKKAHALLGWTANKTLEDMCRDAWRWQKREMSHGLS